MMVVPSLVRQSVQLCLYHRINNVQSVLALPFRVLLKYILCVTCPVHARTDLVSRYRLACVNPVVTRSQVMFIFSPPHVFDQSGTQYQTVARPADLHHMPKRYMYILSSIDRLRGCRHIRNRTQNHFIQYAGRRTATIWIFHL